MQIALVIAFVVIAVAPMVGIWRGHVWAKKKGLMLRSSNEASVETSQAV